MKSFINKIIDWVKKHVNIPIPVPTPTPIPTPVPTPIPVPVPTPTPSPITGKLNCAFLMPAKYMGQYGEKRGYCCTLNWINRDLDRPDPNDLSHDNEQRWYILEYQKKIGANFFPFVLCNNDEDASGRTSPFTGTWGSPIHTELLAWIFNHSSKEFWGNQVGVYGLTYMPCLFLSNNVCKEFSDPHDWHETLIQYIVEQCMIPNGFKYLLTHWEASKFVTSDEVNRIAGLIRKYDPQHKINIGFHSALMSKGNSNFAKCDVDFVAVETNWDPWNGKSHSPSEVSQTINAWLNAGAKQVHMMEYNVYSDSSEAKAQGQEALKNSKCIGVGCGW
jgi:hypothetical protein